jgi:Zn-dependent protease
MSWSWKIARIAGIDVYIHATFLILIFWVIFVFYRPDNPFAVVYGFLFVAAAFTIIVMHEYGHALAARRYGIATRDITLLPIGGVARLERMPRKPSQELVVALAGPAVNVVLAVGLFGLIFLRGGFVPVAEIGVFNLRTFIDHLFFFNVFVALFNMLPAFPMDGGRVLRATLAMRMDYVQATRAAAGIGQGMALLFAFAGLMIPNFFLVFIALFVWLGAAAEAAAVQTQASMAGLPVSAALIRDFVALAPTDNLRSAARHVLNGFQQDFPIVQDGRVIGVLPRADLLNGLADRGPDAPVTEVMRTDFRTTRPDEMLERALERLQGAECPVLPVLDDDRLVGLLTPENIGELIMIREAMARRPVPPKARELVSHD